MASTPRANIADDAAQGLHCAICGEDALHVVHVERLPDYVECAECKSAFIMEDGGERVLYGQIAEGYPQTSQFALKQWVWIEAVETRAREERSPGPEQPTALPAEEPDEQWQPYSSEPTEDADVETPQATDHGWSVLEDPEPAATSEAAPSGEITPESDEAPTGDLPEAPTFEAQVDELIDEESIFEDLAEETLESSGETDIAEAGEPGAESEQDYLDDSDELEGFDWLGGLADEDTMLEEPDLPTASEPTSGEGTAQEIESAEAGLSEQDLDDLFQPEPDLDEGLPPAADDIQDEIGDEGGVFELPDWSSDEPSLSEETVQDDALDSSWLDGIETDDQEPAPATPIIEHDDLDDEPADSQDEWAELRAREPELADDTAEEQVPPEDWLADRITSDSIEPEPEFGEGGSSAEGLSLDDDDAGEDFLSSLRDSAAIPLESRPLEDPSMGASEQEEQPVVPDWALEEEQEEDNAMAARMQAVTSSEQAQPAEAILEELPEDAELADEEPISKDEINFRETDPPPGYRHRVVIGGERVIFPGGECVHCGRTPVKGQLAIEGTLPSGQGMADRKPTRFEVPLCGECRDRATSLSEDARSARTQSLLFSSIIGLALVVGALAFSLVDPADMQLADIFILIILFTVGFAGSAILLLNRIGNYPPPLDAAYVRTTLLVPSETQGLETAFEWRNVDYAERFHEANESKALGGVTRVKDRLILERS